LFTLLSGAWRARRVRTSCNLGLTLARQEYAAMPIASVTRLHLRSRRFLPPFLWYTFRSARQARQTSGNLGVQLRKTNGLAFWTLSMWQTFETMKKFMFTAPHRKAMQRLPHWCDEASFSDWEQATTEWPLWNYATDELRTNGRLAKVLHPSQQQKAGKIVTS